MVLKAIDFPAQVTAAYTSLDSQKKLPTESKESFLSESKSVGLFAFKRKVYSIINDKINLEDPNPAAFKSNIMSQFLRKLMLAGLIIPTKKWIEIYAMKGY